MVRLQDMFRPYGPSTRDCYRLARNIVDPAAWDEEIKTYLRSRANRDSFNRYMMGEATTDPDDLALQLCTVLANGRVYKWVAVTGTRHVTFIFSNVLMEADKQRSRDMFSMFQPRR